MYVGEPGSPPDRSVHKEEVRIQPQTCLVLVIATLGYVVGAREQR